MTAADLREKFKNKTGRMITHDHIGRPVPDYSDFLESTALSLEAENHNLKRDLKASESVGEQKENNFIVGLSTSITNELFPGRSIQWRSMWERAFDEYNKSNIPPLSLSCRPCYNKVFHWHLKKLLGFK